MKKSYILLLSWILICSAFAVFLPIGTCEEASGDIFYVGGAGEGNYSSIQAALDIAGDGDTVYVYNGTYYENIEINKRINLIGENKETTFINGMQGNDEVLYISVDSVTITGFTIQNGDDIGIKIHSNYTTISESIISNNDWGIWIIYSSNSDISNSIFSNNRWEAIYITLESKETIIRNNSFSNNGDGVGMYSCNDSIVSDNTFVNDGLTIFKPNNVTVTNNTINDKPLLYLEGKNNTVIDGEVVGQVILVNCDNITLINLELSITTVGIQLHNTNNCFIMDNIINSNSLDGIYISSSEKNTISNNIISYTGDFSDSSIAGRGIYLHSSTNNILNQNTISNSNYGLFLQDSNSNNISDNNISNNYRGLALWDSENNMISSIYIDSNNHFGSIGIHIFQSNNNTISGNNEISKSNKGLHIFRSNYNLISENSITNNNYGIYFSRNSNSNNNTISKNTFTDNDDDIYFSDNSSNYNIISENIFSTSGENGTPGFEIILVVCSMALVISLKRRRFS